MNTPLPRQFCHIYSLNLIWPFICITGGITLLVFSSLNYVKWNKLQRSLKQMAADLEEARPLHEKRFTAQLELQNRTICMELTEQQISKLSEELGKIKKIIWRAETDWESTAKRLEQQKVQLLRTQAEVEFAKRALQDAGMPQAEVETFTSHLGGKMQPPSR